MVRLEPAGTELGAYLSGRVRPIGALTGELGVRYSRHTHTDDANVGPRILGEWRLGPRTAVRGSWGVYHQAYGIHELEAADGETTFANAEKSQQVAAGIEHAFENGVALRLEAYHRAIDDTRPRYLSLRRSLEAFPEAENDRVRIDPSRSRTQGFEVMDERDLGGRVAWFASYALARAQDEIQGRWVPRTLDQRHAFQTRITWRPSSRWHLSWSWQIHSGWPATEERFRLEVLGDGTPVILRELGPINAERLPTYHRLDARVTRTFDLGAKRLQVYLDVFNLYNRTNLRGYRYWARIQNGALITGRVAGQELLPLLPSWGVRFEF